MDVFEKVKEIMAEQLEVDIDSITLDTSFASDLEADSLDIIEIPDEEAEKISTVQDAVNYIQDAI